jgi:hypothetical protein
MVADGLGHGPLAAKAAMEAVRVFSECAAGSPGELIEAVHGPLRATRGAAVAVASIDLTRRVMTFAGVGNIAGSVLAGGGHATRSRWAASWGTSTAGCGNSNTPGPRERCW